LPAGAVTTEAGALATEGAAGAASTTMVAKADRSISTLYFMLYSSIKKVPLCTQEANKASSE
jgi:hypothetical protein